MIFRDYLYRIYLSWGWKDKLSKDSKAIPIDQVKDLTQWKIFPGTDDLKYKVTDSGEDEIGRVLRSRYELSLKNSIIQFSLEFLEDHYTLFHQPQIGGKVYFLYFIEESLDYIEGLTDARKRIVLEWIQSKKKELEKSDITSLAGNNQRKNKDNDIKIETLAEAFSSDSDYKNIMDLLVEKQYCQPVSYIWKEEQSGTKGMLVALIKNLQYQGYYKIERRITAQEIQNIALNTFKVKISISVIDHIKSKSFDISFIPPCPGH